MFFKVHRTFPLTSPGGPGTLLRNVAQEREEKEEGEEEEGNCEDRTVERWRRQQSIFP